MKKYILLLFILSLIYAVSAVPNYDYFRNITNVEPDSVAVTINYTGFFEGTQIMFNPNGTQTLYLYYNDTNTYSIVDGSDRVFHYYEIGNTSSYYPESMVNDNAVAFLNYDLDLAIVPDLTTNSNRLQCIFPTASHCPAYSSTDTIYGRDTFSFEGRDNEGMHILRDASLNFQAQMSITALVNMRSNYSYCPNAGCGRRDCSHGFLVARAYESSGTSGDDDYRVYYYGSSDGGHPAIQFCSVKTGSSSVNYCSQVNKVPYQRDVMFAFTFNENDTLGSGVRIYVNGTYGNFSNRTDGTKLTLYSGTEVINTSIGGSEADSGNGCFKRTEAAFNGTIAEMRFYNRNLSESEVKALWDNFDRSNVTLDAQEVTVIPTSSSSTTTTTTTTTTTLAQVEIGGWVKDNDGNAVEGASIIAVYQDNTLGNSILKNTTSSAATTGRWRMNVSPRGNYSVYAYNNTNTTQPDIQAHVQVQ